MIVLEPRKGAVEEPWRATIPSFQDEALFQEYRETLKARRCNLAPDQGEESGTYWRRNVLSRLQKTDRQSREGRQ